MKKQSLPQRYYIFDKDDSVIVYRPLLKIDEVTLNIRGNRIELWLTTPVVEAQIIIAGDNCTMHGHTEFKNFNPYDYDLIEEFPIGELYRKRKKLN